MLVKTCCRSYYWTLITESAHRAGVIAGVIAVNTSTLYEAQSLISVRDRWKESIWGPISC